jgi:NADH-quinone oxidoreductase E subunit
MGGSVNTEIITQSVREHIGKFPDSRAALLPVLHDVQNREGWLAPESMHRIAEMLEIPPSVVRGFATFYAMYRKEPVGRHLIQLCTNVVCLVMGAEKLLDILKNEFSVEPGKTSPDGRFSLVIMECIGACGSAPSMLVNDEHYDFLDKERLLEILKRYN